MKKLILLGLILALTTSCSSYMNSIYRDFEQQERANSDVDVADGFEQYRNTKRRTSREYNRIDKTITTGNARIVAPSVKRQYKPEKEAVKRFTASDLTDNGNDGSLWGGGDPNAFLFSSSTAKNSGDIVQIAVLPRLKNEITMELKKAFPENPFDIRAQKEKANSKQAESTNDSAAAEKAAEKEKREVASESSMSEGPQDKISGVVVEEINREHLLIKGRKNVLFKNRKRMVEVQALVSRKDIGENDIISSDAILESSVTVVR